MRTFALLATSLVISLGTVTSTQAVVSTGQTHVCPKCGKVHVRSSGIATTATGKVTDSGSSQHQPASSGALVTSRSAVRVSGGVVNVLDALNAQRARQGIASLRYDPQLQVVAQRRVQLMAATGLKNHPPGTIAPGRYEGVGWSSSYSPSGVSACFTSDPRMHCAGAAMATGRDGVYFAVVYR